MKTLLFVVVGLALVAVAVSTPFGAQAQATKAASRNAVTITIDNFSFNAKTESVAAGSQVTWINRDDVPHKIVSTDKKIVSPVLDTDGRFSYTFTAPGTYEYYCSIHPMMTGKIVVK
jgi:amicyanin